MKKTVLWLISAGLAVMLAGCAGSGGEAQDALAFRQRLLEAGETEFRARIHANYIETVERFTLDCRCDGGGTVQFTVSEPEEISGIRGTVSGESGSLAFEDTVLTFPLLAQERISPVSGPWILMQALRGGYITACVREGELLRVTVEDTFAGTDLTVDVWLRGEQVAAGEIAWQGIRQMTLELDGFSVK